MPTEHLFDGPYSLFSIPLAQALGLHAAIFLDRLNFWLQQDYMGKEVDGHKWIYNSYPGWQEQFPFFTVRQVRILIQRLEGEGFLLSRDNLNKFAYDHTKWYTINYSLLDELSIKATSPMAGTDSVQQLPSSDTDGRGYDTSGRTIPVITQSIPTTDHEDQVNPSDEVLGKRLKIVNENPDDLILDKHQASPIETEDGTPKDSDGWKALMKTKGKHNERVGVLARYVWSVRPVEAEAAGKHLYSHLGKLMHDCKTAEGALKALIHAYTEGGENLIVYAGVLNRNRRWDAPAEETKRFAS